MQSSGDRCETNTEFVSSSEQTYKIRECNLLHKSVDILRILRSFSLKVQVVLLLVLFPNMNADIRAYCNCVRQFPRDCFEAAKLVSSEGKDIFLFTTVSVSLLDRTWLPMNLF